MNPVIRLACCALLLGTLTPPCRADGSDLSRQTFEGQGFRTVFTFRNNVLIHEIAVFASGPAKRNSWVERFYVDGQQVFLRAGAAGPCSMHFSGSAPVHSVDDGRRLYVGREAFNRGEDGLFHVIADPHGPLQESAINDPVFSSHALDQERQRHLGKTTPK